MKLDGISVVCSREECPLCEGRGFISPKPLDPADVPTLCSHVLPNTVEFTGQMEWAMHLAEASGLRH